MARSVISKTIFIALFFCFLLIASFGVQTAEAQRGGGGGGGKGKLCGKPARGWSGKCSKPRCNSWCKSRERAERGDCKRTCYCYKKC
ncbi:PREDICTED: defensin-like protein 17 isoform X2 [Ipomoea nil]|uniref:defensin-like protein 17 isoform X2 n=1 Tax=Ipomoea nil TaxID=35883 RepID=UPI0009009904|nr:PREDICTED: defensin-like protein 17 isoform X2 [Ipomoea nil]